MSSGRLGQALQDVAQQAPDVLVPAGLYRSARRRHRSRRVWSAVAMVVLVLGAGLTVAENTPTRPGPGGNPAGLPSRIVEPPWWTDTVEHSPTGPASVVFSAGKGTIQSDSDPKLEWWRDGSTVAASVVVGLDQDTYRVVRGSYYVGEELSPNGRYLILYDRVLDLVSGKTTQLPNVGEDPNLGEEAYGWWSADGQRILLVHYETMTVVSWPSGRIDWTVRHPGGTPSGRYLALSVDGSMLAVFNAAGLTVYRRDGSRLWSRAGQDQLAGSAAWLGNDRLATMHRTESVYCNGCETASTWQLAFVDAKTGEPAPEPAPGQAFPVLRSALDVRLVAWRGDSAYAIVRYAAVSTDHSAGAGRVELVRLRPGAAQAETVLVAPATTETMNVATDFVDVVRPTGSPQEGLNLAEVFGRVLTAMMCLSPLEVGLVVVLLIRKRRRRARVPRSP